MPRLKYLLVAITILLAFLACDESAPVSDNPERIETTSLPNDNIQPKGNRILELDVNPSEDQNFDRSMELARELGVESIRLSIFWDEFETSPGKFDPDPNWLEIANDYYSSQGFSISLVISVLDTTETRLPQDLEGLSFADPKVSSRFKGMLDYVKSQLVDVELVSLAIGNEIDGILGNNQEAWNAYTLFYEQTSRYARELWPGVPISTKVTFDCLTGPSAAFSHAIYKNSSVIMTTYYPLKGNFTVMDPAVVIEDFSTLAQTFPNKEIQITEIGYPTSSLNDSSPERQAQFIQNMFLAWDQHANAISVLSYSWLTDLPDDSVKDLEAYYGISSEAFGEFLRTLGLRTYPGTGENKIGFETFKAETTARGW